MEKVRIIPADGKITAAQLHSKKGECEICNTTPTTLQRHFLLTHAGNEERREFAILMNHIIPAHGNIAVSEVYSGPGLCQICDIWITQLRRHYEHHHADGKTGHGGTYEVKEIPEDGNVKIAAVYSGPGYCKMSGCDKSIYQLRQHFVNVHVKKTRKCPECQKDVVCGSYSGHMQSHIRPMKCSACQARSESLQGVKCHIKRRHKDDPSAQPLPMTPDEVAAYEVYKEEAALRTAMRQVGRARITDHGQVLVDYENRLTNPTDSLAKRAMRLKNDFNSFIQTPDETAVKCNASFISIWNSQLKIPSVVFEVVEKTTVYEIFESTHFFQDTKIQHEQPTRKDYAETGFHRGHLAAAQNYHDIMLVAPTYYYNNIVPMFPDFNTVMRQALEAHVRKMADENGEVKVFHFPLLEGAVQKIGKGIAVPSSVATVTIVQKSDGLHIHAWELWNQQALYDFHLCERYPFSVFQKAGFEFQLSPTDFVFVSKDAL